MNSQDKEKLRVALELLTRHQDDQEAWRNVFVFTWATAVASANRILRGTIELAEDAAQEAFARIIRYANFRRINDPDIFVAYLKAVTRNVALNTARRLGSDARQIAPEFSVESEPSDAFPTPHETYLAGELRDQLAGLLDDDDRRLLDMVVEGQSLGEISEKLQIGYSAAGVRLHRLREKVRNYLNKR